LLDGEHEANLDERRLDISVDTQQFGDELKKARKATEDLEKSLKKAGGMQILHRGSLR
jgi:hypothetical protein